MRGVGAIVCCSGRGIVAFRAFQAFAGRCAPPPCSGMSVGCALLTAATFEESACQLASLPGRMTSCEFTVWHLLPRNDRNTSQTQRPHLQARRTQSASAAEHGWMDTIYVDTIWMVTIHEVPEMTQETPNSTSGINGGKPSYHNNLDSIPFQPRKVCETA